MPTDLPKYALRNALSFLLGDAIGIFIILWPELFIENENNQYEEKCYICGLYSQFWKLKNRYIGYYLKIYIPGYTKKHYRRICCSKGCKKYGKKILSLPTLLDLNE